MRKCVTPIPAGGPDLTVVEAGSLAFVDWHRGARSWRDVLRSGDIRCPARRGYGGRSRHGTRSQGT